MSLPSLSALSHSCRCGAHTGTLFTDPPDSEVPEKAAKWFYATGECSICQELLFVKGPNPPGDAPDKNAVIGLTCGHLFHKACLSPAVRVSSNCPICRSRIEEVDMKDLRPPPTDYTRYVLGPRSARDPRQYSFGHDDGLYQLATIIEQWITATFDTPDERLRVTQRTSADIERQISDWWQVQLEIDAEQTTTEHVDAVKHLAGRIVLIFLAPANGAWFRANYTQQLLRLKGAAVRFLVTAKLHAPDTIASFARGDAFESLVRNVAIPAAWAGRTPWVGFLEYMETLDVNSDEYVMGLELFREASGLEYVLSDRRTWLSWLW